MSPRPTSHSATMSESASKDDQTEAWDFLLNNRSGFGGVPMSGEPFVFDLGIPSPKAKQKKGDEGIHTSTSTEEKKDVHVKLWPEELQGVAQIVKVPQTTRQQLNPEPPFASYRPMMSETSNCTTVTPTSTHNMVVSYPTQAVSQLQDQVKYFSEVDRVSNTGYPE